MYKNNNIELINFYDLPADILQKIYMINHRQEREKNKLIYNDNIKELNRLHHMPGITFYRCRNLLKKINKDYIWWRNNLCWDNLR